MRLRTKTLTILFASRAPRHHGGLLLGHGFSAAFHVRPLPYRHFMTPRWLAEFPASQADLQCVPSVPAAIHSLAPPERLHVA